MRGEGDKHGSGEFYGISLGWVSQRITKIRRDGDMYWMLEMNWFQDNLVLAKFVHKILVLGTAVRTE